jgi:hypothetical protein
MTVRIFRGVRVSRDRRLLSPSYLSVRLSTCSTRLPLDWFSWDFLLVTFTNTCRENPDFLKIRQTPSVHTYHRGSHWTDFREICYWLLLRTSVEKLQISLKIGQECWALYMMTKVYFIFLTATYVAQQYKSNALLRWQRWLRECATTLRYSTLPTLSASSDETFSDFS